MARPTGLQFSSSQAVICVCRWPRPCGGTPILIRTGRRRSAEVIMSLPRHQVLIQIVAAVPSRLSLYISRCPAAWARRAARLFP